MTIRSVADRIVSSVGHPVSINYGALDYRQDECIDCWPDTGLAESMNLYRDLTPFDEAMDETVRWYRTHPKVWSSVAVSE
jgi:nucleoside-diphosphate-sugar epimerase